MAIFLSRIKRALNVGSKSITNNGTYYASADGYDGYDEVTVNVSGGSATPITPSNANPVALISGVAVEPTANGYAIQSYDNITPPSSPQAISSGDILKMIGNGYVIDTYSTATPSDNTPPQLSQGYVYVPNGNGYLYENQYNTTPKIFMGGLGGGASAGYIDIVQDLVEGTTYARDTSHGSAAFGCVYFGRPRNISVTSTQGRWICVHPDNTTTTLAQSITNANVDNVLYMVNSKGSGAAFNVKVTYR